jgi:dihydrofolate synthase/folylpolyglutamate synthase
VIEARAAEIGSPLARLGRDFEVEVLGCDLDGLSLRLTDGPLRAEVKVPALGLHQARNAALALACANRAVGHPTHIRLGECAARGFAAVELPGRVELLGRSPWLLVDSAHTAESSAALAEILEQIPRRRAHLVLSISAGKNVETILASLLPGVDEVTVTRAEPVRSLSPDEVANAIRATAPDISMKVVPNPQLAIRAAREGLGSEDLLCVAGSVYLAGIARKILKDPDSDPPVQVSRRNAK